MTQCGRDAMRWFNHQDEGYSASGIAQGSSWTSPVAFDGNDWVIVLSLLKRGKCESQKITGKTNRWNL